jgi:hypothetical protein
VEGAETMKTPTNLGLLLVGIWLILFALLHNSFLSITVAHSGDLLALLALVAGILLLMRR